MSSVKWNVIDHSNASTLPPEDGSYLVSVGIQDSESGLVPYPKVSVMWYFNDRDFCLRRNKMFSRKYQRKLSVHFSDVEGSYTVLAWAEVPEVYREV